MTPYPDSMEIIDTHTHTLRPGAVVNIDPSAIPLSALRIEAPYFYSVGIHPWNAGVVRPSDIRTLRRLARDRRVLAIGETGLDSVHVGYEWVEVSGRKEPEIREAVPSIERQTELLRLHIGLSEELCKPLILHVVKRFPEIMNMRRTMRPSQPWIIHGYRGKPGLARDLLRLGFYLSYGERFNPASVAVTPPDRLLLETDESALTVAEIASLAGVTACSQCIADKARELGALDGGALENP